MSFLAIPQWLVPSSFPGVPQSQAGGTPSKEVPRMGYPPSQVRMGYPSLQPSQDGVLHQPGLGYPQPGQDGAPPPQPRLGYPLGRLRLGRLRREGGGGPPLTASHGGTLLLCESFHCAWILFKEVWLSSFPGSRKGRCNYQRKHEYIMRSRSLVQKIKQLGEPTNTKASQPKEMANSITKEVSTSAISSSPDGTTTFVDFIQEPLQNMTPKCDSTEFTQDQPLNLSKKTQNQIIAPKASALYSNKYILVFN